VTVRPLRAAVRAAAALRSVNVENSVSVFIGEPSYTKRSPHASPRSLEAARAPSSPRCARKCDEPAGKSRSRLALGTWPASAIYCAPIVPLAEAETSTETEMFAWIPAVIFAAA